MKKIMFICTGNVCRSPMAHAYMKKRIKDLKKENEYIISSCGTHAIKNQRATNNAIEVMKKYEVDLKEHLATRMEDSNIINFDLIFALTEIHKKEILNIYPSLSGKVFTLKEYVNKNEKYIDIDDPWGLDIVVYDATANEIVRSIDKLIKMI